MHTLRITLASAISAMIMLSCETENDTIPGRYSKGVFIVNEGSFMSNNGSVSFYHRDSGVVVNNIFEAANGRPLGDVVQAMGISGDNGYLVVNGSGKVEIVRLETFSTVSEPLIVSYPRFFLQAGSGKGYLTAGSMEGWVYIIDTRNHVIADSLAVGYGPEAMLMLNDRVYVANSGGWGLDSTLTLINTVTDEVSGSIVVGDAPVDMALDKHNNLWAYCKGYAVYSWEPPYELVSETNARLVRINTANNTVNWEGIVGTAGEYNGKPPKLAMGKGGEELYYLRYDGVYKISTSQPEIAAAPIIEGSYYGLEVDPANGELYLFQSSFTGNGSLVIVDPLTLESRSYMVGIGPNGAVFR